MQIHDARLNHRSLKRGAPKAMVWLRAVLLCALWLGVAGGLVTVGCGGPPPPKKPPKKKVVKKKKKKVIPKAKEDPAPAACVERDKALEKEFAAYIDAFSNRGLEISPNGKQLLFLSNRAGGTYQLYVSPVRKTGAEPTIIAEEKDGVSAARYTPTGKHILFLRDKDKNENTQLYRSSADGKDVLPLTDAPKMFHHLPQVTADGKTLVYFRGSHKSGKYELVRQSIDGGEAKILHVFKGFHVLTDLSPDGARALIFKLKSLSESQLWLATLDAAKGKTGEAAAKADKAADKASKAAAKADKAADKADKAAAKADKNAGKAAKAVKTAKKALKKSKKALKKAKKASKKAKKATSKITLKRLAPTKGKKAHAHYSRFSSDGASVYVITDEDVEVAGLNRIDAASGEMATTFNDYEAEVADVAVSPKGKTVAVLLDAGSHHSVKLLDATKLEEKRLKIRGMPKGSVGLGRFTADGKGLLLTLSTPSAPAEIFLLDTRRGRLKMMRRDPRSGLRKMTAVKAVVERVETFDRLKVPMNVYLPKRMKRGVKLPVIVSIHGGPAASSSIHWSPMITFWVNRGFAVVEPNVRGSTGFGKTYEQADNGRKRMDALKDLKAVNTWIREQPWADVERIVAFGGSYGGYMVYMAMGHQPEIWNLGIGLVGVVNLKTFLKHTTGAIRLVFEDEFGKLPKDGKFLASISPIKKVGDMRAAMFIYQGANDPRVPRSEQDQMVRALRKRGLPVEYMIAEDEGHSMSRRHNKLEFVSRTMRFIEANLDLPGPSDDCRSVGKPAKEEEAKGKKAKGRSAEDARAEESAKKTKGAPKKATSKKK